VTRRAGPALRLLDENLETERGYEPPAPAPTRNRRT